MPVRNRGPLISLSVPSLDGGIGRNLVNLTNSFTGMGYGVHILAEKRGDPSLESNVPTDSIHILSTAHTVGGIPGMISYLRRYKPSVMLTPVLRHTLLALGARALTGSDVLVFANIHNTYSKLYENLPKRKKNSRFRKFTRYYPRCDGIIAVSKGVADDFSILTGLPGERIRVIYNPIVNPGIAAAAGKAVSHPWFEPGQPPVILGAGRLVAAKNFSLLLRSFEIIRQSIRSRCVILGDGPLRSEIERWARASQFPRDIQLIGHQSNPFAFMSRAAIFVLSSSWEGFGNVLVEAMAVGTPVVSTDCPSGPREILENGKYGTLVPPDDPHALARAVIDGLESPRSPETLRAGISRFEADAVAREYLRAFGFPSRDDSRVKTVLD